MTEKENPKQETAKQEDNPSAKCSENCSHYIDKNAFIYTKENS